MHKLCKNKSLGERSRATCDRHFRTVNHAPVARNSLIIGFGCILGTPRIACTVTACKPRPNIAVVKFSTSVILLCYGKIICREILPNPADIASFQRVCQGIGISDTPNSPAVLMGSWFRWDRYRRPSIPPGNRALASRESGSIICFPEAEATLDRRKYVIPTSGNFAIRS